MKIAVGDIVLIQSTDTLWDGSLMKVEEVRVWGVTGDVIGIERSHYPMRVGYEEIAAVYRRVPDEYLK